MEAICLAYKRQYKVELTESIRLHYMNDAGPLIVNIILYFTQSDVKNLHEV